MSTLLSDDLRHALQTEGTPLRLVDPATGERYVLLSESAFEKSRSAPAGNQAALDQSQISGSRLMDLAKRHAPPAAWLESEEEELF